MLTMLWWHREPRHRLQWTSYQIRKIERCACTGNAGTFSPLPSSKVTAIVSDPGMLHGTCVMHMPWCMSGSLTRGGGENVPGIPGACATRNFTYLARGPCYWLHNGALLLCVEHRELFRCQLRRHWQQRRLSFWQSAVNSDYKIRIMTTLVPSLTV